MENVITPELLAEAKQVKTAEELKKLAGEKGIELTQEEAKDFYEQMHKTGELSDDELDNVSGGGCQVEVDGRKHTVVTSQYSCDRFRTRYGEASGLRLLWRHNTNSRSTCPFCDYLEFKGGTGYCMIK